jgi:hypothetical protein
VPALALTPDAAQLVYFHPRYAPELRLKMDKQPAFWPAAIRELTERINRARYNRCTSRDGGGLRGLWFRETYGTAGCLLGTTEPGAIHLMNYVYDAASMAHQSSQLFAMSSPGVDEANNYLRHSSGFARASSDGPDTNPRRIDIP